MCLRCLAASDDLSSDLAKFQAASRLDPANREGQLNLGLALLRMGRAKEATVPLSSAAQDQKLASRARYLLGMAHFQLANYAQAVAELQGIEVGPDMEHVLYLREECNRVLGRQQEARKEFVELNRRFPESSWMHFLMGNALENQAQPEKALAEYKLAVERNPSQPNASFAVGYLYWRQQDSENAKPWFEKELSLQSCHALASFYLGEIARTSQKPNDAARYYRRSLACNPDSSEAHLRLGIILAEERRNDEAVHELQAAAKLDPVNPTPHYRLALLYKGAGRSVEAQSEYAAIRQIQSTKAKSEPQLTAKP